MRLRRVYPSLCHCVVLIYHTIIVLGIKRSQYYVQDSMTIPFARNRDGYTVSDAGPIKFLC